MDGTAARPTQSPGARRGQGEERPPSLPQAAPAHPPVGRLAGPPVPALRVPPSMGANGLPCLCISILQQYHPTDITGTLNLSDPSVSTVV